MFQTLRLLNSLSPAQRSVIEARQFSGVFTAEALIDQMRMLAEFDEHNDSTRAALKKFLAMTIVLALACLWFFMQLPIIAIPAVSVPVIVAIYLGVMLRRLSKLDISDNFRQVALPFIALIKQDMQPTQTMTVHLDLALPTDAKKFITTSKPYQHGAYKNIVDTTYRDAWFEGMAHLADASVLRWRVVDDICHSKRSKRSRSGKTKTKTRACKRSLIAITLSVVNKAYGVNATAPAAEQADEKVAVQNGTKRRTIKLVRKFKTKSMDPMDPRMLIDTISSAYRRVTPPSRSAA